MKWDVALGLLLGWGFIHSAQKTNPKIQIQDAPGVKLICTIDTAIDEKGQAVFEVRAKKIYERNGRQQVIDNKLLAVVKGKRKKAYAVCDSWLDGTWKSSKFGVKQ